MKFLLFFEGIFFACFYSTAPFFAMDLLNNTDLGYYVIEPLGRKEMRYFIISSFGFFFFYLYTISGLRTRYILWHLERKRYGSGFIPLEALAVCCYHSVLLCLLTETLLPALDGKKPQVLSELWIQNLGIWMKHVFLFSLIGHTAYELSGFADKIRREYFEVDRA